jgi:hypothetical protein
VVFGASTSPFLLAATIRKHLKPYETEPEVVEILRESLYVDEFIASSRSTWVLPNKSRYSEMLIQYHHEKVMHSGASDTQHPTLNKTQKEVQAETCDQFLEQLAKRLLAGSKVSTPLQHTQTNLETRKD